MIVVRTNYPLIGAGQSTTLDVTGGVEPYVFSLAPNGAGGTIDQNGVYTAPSYIPDVASKGVETIIVTDSDVVPSETRFKLNVSTPIKMLANILQREMGLVDDQVYLYNQKFNIPNDGRIYVSIGFLSTRPFSNNSKHVGQGSDLVEIQSTNIRAMLTVEILGRTTEAMNRKEEILLAVGSDYSKQIQQAMGFNIARISTNFVNLSKEEGPAIPYRFNITLVMHYTVVKTKSVQFFDTFLPTNLIIDR